MSHSPQHDFPSPVISPPLAPCPILLRCAIPVCACQGCQYTGSLHHQPNFPPIGSHSFYPTPCHIPVICPKVLVLPWRSSCPVFISYSSHSPVSCEIHTYTFQFLSPSFCYLHLRFLPKPPSHFLPMQQQRSCYEGRGEKMGDLILKEGLQGKFGASLLTHLSSLETSQADNPAKHSIFEGTKYNLVNTRKHRCWGFTGLRKTSKSNLFHPHSSRKNQYIHVVLD